MIQLVDQTRCLSPVLGEAARFCACGFGRRESIFMRNKDLALRVLSTAAMLSIVSSIASTAFAGTYNIKDGSISVKSSYDSVNDKTTNKVTQKNSDGSYVKNSNGDEINDLEDNDDAITIKGDKTETSNTIKIDVGENAKANITLDDVNIKSSNDAALKVTGKGDVDIELDGDNTLTSGSKHAGLEKNDSDSDGKLTIKDDLKNDGTVKSDDEKKAEWAAAAEDKKGDAVKDIGSLTARGGIYGAGIGGGSSFGDYGGYGFVTIDNATVEKAQGDKWGGAGIGNGGGELQRTRGGFVDLINAVIGKFDSNGDPVSNTGAIGGAKAAGIGDGENTPMGSVTISGKNTQISAKGGDNSSAISPTPTLDEDSGLKNDGSGNISHNHTNTEVKNAKDATCTEEGYTGDTVCKDCGQTIKTGTTIPKTAHTPGDWEVEIPATCTSEGKKVQKCSKCGEVLKTDIIEKLDHNFGEWETVKPATCTEDGTKHRQCSVGGEWEDGVIPATGHNYEWVTDTAANCENTGKKKHECTKCGDIDAWDTIDKTAHTPGDWEVEIPATCTSEGKKVQKCSKCGEVLQTGIIEKLDHNFGE